MAATFEGKIYARSPFYITATGTTVIIAATLEVFIWNGDEITDKPGAATYTLTKVPNNASDTNIVFEISQLIRDFLENAADNYTATAADLKGAFWVETSLVVNQSTGGVQAAIEERRISIDGYGYFEDGINPDTSNFALVDNDTIITLDDGNTRIPLYVNTDGTHKVEYVLDNVVVSTVDYTSTVASADSFDKVRYSVYGESFQERVVADSGTFENSVCLESALDSIDLNEIDSIRIHDVSGVVRTFTVQRVEECKYVPHRVSFINKHGALEDLWFFKTSRDDLNVKKQSYSSILGNVVSNAYTYDVAAHNKVDYNVVGSESIALSSGFVPESFNENFRQLLLSEQVWIQIDGLDKPVSVATRNLNFQKNVNERLINYEIKLEFSNNKINDIT